MPENIPFIRELLTYVDCYQNQTGRLDMKEFALFLKDKMIKGDADKIKSPEFDASRYEQYRNYPEVEFSTLLTTLYRFAKHYIKKAFGNTSFKTIDEFGFLATLLKEESLLKNELINKHLLEISSGSEILKRLIKNGLVYEYPDENDKRAKRVALTDAGKREIFIAFGEMHKVSEIIIGNLTGSELNDALSAFNKLNYFHQNIHAHDRNTPLNELHSIYVPQK